MIKRWYIYVITAFLLGGVVFASVKFFKRVPEHNLVKVVRGDIREEVQATGEVVPKKRVEMGFETQGRLDTIDKSEGEEVQRGNRVMTLENNSAYSSVLEAEALYKKSQADLDRVTSGATEAQIRVYESNLRKAEVDLEEKDQDLIQAEDEADEDTLSAYEDALSTLEDASLKVENALDDVDNIQRSYFSTNDQTSIVVKRAEASIERSLEALSLDDIDEAIIIFKDELSSVADDLEEVRSACDEPSYRNDVSSTDKTTLDNHRSYINTALEDVRNERQNIASIRLNNTSTINAAKRARDEARETVEMRRAELEDVSNPPEGYEIEAAEAEVKRMLAALNRARSEFSKSILTSPCDGRVVKVRAEIGELIRAQDEAVSILCEGGFEVELDVPETDIGQLSVGDRTEVSFYAFPEDKYEGNVIDIEPAETIIQGVVYYKVRIGLEVNNGVKPGMTAEVDVITQEKKNVLIIPQRAVEDGMVQVWDGGEQRVQLGIEDRSANVEVLSGLTEGQELILNHSD